MDRREELDKQGLIIPIALSKTKKREQDVMNLMWGIFNNDLTKTQVKNNLSLLNVLHNPQGLD